MSRSASASSVAAVCSCSGSTSPSVAVGSAAESGSIGAAAAADSDSCLGNALGSESQLSESLAASSAAWRRCDWENNSLLLAGTTRPGGKGSNMRCLFGAAAAAAWPSLGGTNFANLESICCSPRLSVSCAFNNSVANAVALFSAEVDSARRVPISKCGSGSSWASARA